MADSHSSHSVIDDDGVFRIDPFSRSINYLGDDSPTLVQCDHNSERYTFEIPRIIEGHDMSTCNLVEVHYDNYNTGATRKNSNIYKVDDLGLLEEDQETVTFSWLISSGATQIVGMLDFSICFQCVAEDGTKDYVWSTSPFAGVNVISTTHNTEIVVEQHSDFISRIEAQMLEISNLAAEVENRLNNELPKNLSDLNNDLVFAAVLMKDKTTGKPYQLYVDGDKLVIAEVSTL